VTPPPTAPRLRRPDRLTLSKIAGLLLSSVRAVEATIEPRAEEWDRRNDEALASDGPLWLVLGDSTSQGIGSSTIETSYVHVVRERLDDHTGRSWRVLNLSVTGARMGGVVEGQLAAWDYLELEADLVTCLAGANDVFARSGSRTLASAAGRLLDALPFGSVVGQLGASGPSRRRVSLARDLFREWAGAGHIVLFDPWRWPTMRGMWAQDRVHPNDQGYAAIADQLWDALTEVVPAR
jgi:lysophospholipase L1-like esterase